VSGQRYIVQVADTHQHLDIRLVGMFAERVAKKDNRIELAFSSHGGDLRVAAPRAAQFELHAQARLQNVSARSAGGDEFGLAQFFEVVFDECDHFGFLAVVCDNRDSVKVCHYSYGVFWVIWSGNSKGFWPGGFVSLFRAATSLRGC